MYYSLLRNKPNIDPKFFTSVSNISLDLIDAVASNVVMNAKMNGQIMSLELKKRAVFQTWAEQGLTYKTYFYFIHYIQKAQ